MGLYISRESGSLFRSLALKTIVFIVAAVRTSKLMIDYYLNCHFVYERSQNISVIIVTRVQGVWPMNLGLFE
jgi:hypothetical protein